MGFEEATPIQEKAIPAAMEGHDIMGQAQTGTGKTAAFGIPMVEAFDINTDAIQGIVITPTRELAVQVAEELNRIGQFKGIRALPIYGGQDIQWQIKALKRKPQIIVGTPGRLVDHMMRRKTIKLNHIKVVVLDEADEMLDMGFKEDIEAILETTPKERQTMLFSATIPGVIQKLAKRFMKDPVKIGTTSGIVTVPAIEQVYLEVPEKLKFEVLCRMLDTQLPSLAIVFGRTRKRVNELSEALNKRGYPADGIHGDLIQSKRNAVLQQFKNGKIEVLVATDVAARGLDITGVTHVYNFDIPQDAESYVHRIGRTGRAGKTGMSVTFVTPRETALLRQIERTTGHVVARMPVPSMSEAIEGQQRVAVEKILGVIGGTDISKYKGMAESLLEEHDAVVLLSGALKLLSKEREVANVELTEEAPARSKHTREPGGRSTERKVKSRMKQGEWRGDKRNKGRR